jgi:hypothetical protein
MCYFHPPKPKLYTVFYMRQTKSLGVTSGIPRNFVWGRGGSTNSVEDRENGDLGAVAP